MKNFDNYLTGRMASCALLCSFLLIIPTVYCFKCHSCFTGCSSLSNCDCKNHTCDGDYCFVKVERFPEDDVSSILKGCVDFVTQDLIGCQHAGDNYSIECYCNGDMCNSAKNLQNYEAKILPKVECCECNTNNGRRICRFDACLHTCRGNYCYLDMDAQSQGCGIGYPQLYNELRTKNLSKFLPRQTCVKSTSGDPQISPWIRGCACASDHCNRYPSSEISLDLEPTSQNQQIPHITCHSFADSSEKPIKIETYGERGFCKGNFCYLTLTTHQVVLESDDNANRRYDEDDEDDEDDVYEEQVMSELKVTPYFHEKYDFSVGCLIVDNSSKVQLGCTTEYGENMSKIFTRHCICSGDYCNFYNLMTGETDVTLVPRRKPFNSKNKINPRLSAPMTGDKQSLPPTNKVNSKFIQNIFIFFGVAYSTIFVFY